MKIAILIPYLSGEGGMETVLKKLIAHFESDSALSIDFLFVQGVAKAQFATRFSTQEMPIDYSGHAPKIVRQSKGIFRTWHYLFANKPDMVICMSTKLIRLVHWFRRAMSAQFKIISWIHFSLFNPQEPLNVKDIQRADFHLSISHGVSKQLQQIGIHQNKIFFISNPISEATVSISPSQSNQPVEFLYVGRLIWEGMKNLKQLFMTLPLLSGAWHLTVIGDGKDAKTMSDYCDQNNLNAKVTFTGWQVDPWADVRVADCTLLTSTFEGLGLSLIESIARGVPVISSDCPVGPKEIVTSDNGYLFPTGDSKKLLMLMQKFIDRNVHFDTANVIQSVSQYNNQHFFSGFEHALDQIAKTH